MRLSRPPLLLSFLAALVIGFAFPTFAGIITVKSNADSLDVIPGDGICADELGRCTLRAAIDEANAVAGQDAIIFDLQVPAEITLHLGELKTTDPVGIYGRGAHQLTVRRSDSDQTSNFRVFHFAANTELRGITVSNGFAGIGGGILAAAHTNLFDVAVTGNRSDSGGGIAFQSSFFISNTVTRCLIDSNIVNGQGGGLYIAPNAYLELKSSTITNNSAAGGGGIANSGVVISVNNTIARDMASQSSSGVLNSPGARIEIINTIISSGTKPSTSLVQGQFLSLGRNLVANTTGSSGWVGSDLTSTDNSIDPLLGPLTNNGGQTNTLAPLPGSPAIEAGDDCVVFLGCGILCPAGCGEFMCRSEQRRVARKIGARVDIGAVETGAIIAMHRRPEQISFGVRQRFTFSRIEIINTETLERYQTFVTLAGASAVRDLDVPGTYVYEVHSKRLTPQIPFVLDLVGTGN